MESRCVYFPVLSRMDLKVNLEGQDFYLIEKYPNWLVNAIYLKDNMLEFRKLVKGKLLVDSGGLQAFMYGKKFNKNEIFERQAIFADLCFILDQPEYDGNWEEGINNTNKNIEIAVENYGLKDKLILILHGDTIEKAKRWWDVIGRWDIDKVAIGNKNLESLNLKNSYFVYSTFLLEYDERKWKYFHFLAFSSSLDLAFVSLLSKYYGDRVETFGFDSKTPLAFAYNLTYILEDKKYRLKDGLKKGGIYYGNDVLPCDCEACKILNEKGWKNFLNGHNIATLYNLLTLHNLYQIDKMARKFCNMEEKDLVKYIEDSLKNNLPNLRIFRLFVNYKRGGMSRKDYLDKLELLVKRQWGLEL